METNYEVIILGGGPAGFTAGIYLGRSKVKTLILNEGSAGGQMVLTHLIENYPGIESVSGYEMGKTMQKQAKRFGCEIKNNVSIEQIYLEGELKKVRLKNGTEYTAKALVIATGGTSRSLGVKGEDDFKGRGISYCATCDGEFYQDKEIVVVGGGNSALEEAVSLTKYVTKATILHMLDNFQAHTFAVEEAQANAKINCLMQHRIIEFKGNEMLQSIRIENIATGEISEKKIDGVFIFIGYEPNTKMFEGILTLNNRNEIVTDANLQTNFKGVFAAGDARDTKFRQVTTAVADGTIAALNAIAYVQQ